jgi:hypothetical protein
MVWTLDLVGVVAESETKGWIGKLSDDEVGLATRLSMMELSGFAAYFDELIESRCSVVQEVLEKEMKVQFTFLDSYAVIVLTSSDTAPISANWNGSGTSLV